MLQGHFQAPWVSTFNHCLEHQLLSHENTQPFITFQLATIDNETGFPHNRTLVYRGWLFDDKSSNVITFTTDKRMSKYRELMANDKFEAVFYLSHVKKQFRFRGRARIISDECYPTIDLSGLYYSQWVQDTDLIITSATDDRPLLYHQQLQALIGHQPSQSHLQAQPHGVQRHDEHRTNGKHHAVEVQKQPISSSVLSPTVGTINSHLIDDYSSIEFIPPSKDDWDEEIERQWHQLLKKLKKSFRKPTPKEPITDSNAKLISSINRGVDGKKDDAGLTNFAVVGLFIEYVDFYELDKDRRYIYEMDEFHQWSEQEVCP